MFEWYLFDGFATRLYVGINCILFMGCRLIYLHITLEDELSVGPTIFHTFCYLIFSNILL